MSTLTFNINLIYPIIVIQLLGATLKAAFLNCLISSMHSRARIVDKSLRGVYRQLEYGYEVLYPVLGVLCNTLRNPSQVSDLLLLQLHVSVENTVLKLL